ncbi:glycosyltransferase family 2 protein [Sphingobacterium tabacisoli]|uniref:Glycosyltransferase family 2 protein n=1 Tax=Sphingobacterium tabacisoli TaxID=2044855 RepID=A0ABW5L2J0_9SPHI|nr:glycosyltransferase family 2 protein [Sphingobacterium tabacisoli]
MNKSSSPMVSILVPIYGVEKFIERCAISLFEQTFEDIEFVFVNDCTKDFSVEILKSVLEKYPKRQSQVRIINHDINKGLAAARNTAVSNATGDYILHVDSDDYLELNAVELLYEKAIKENADIVVCDFHLIWEKTSQPLLINIGENKIDLIRSILSAEIMMGIVNKLVRKTMYLDNNIEAEEGVDLGEDYMVIPKLFYYANNIAKVNSPLYYYSQTNPNSYTTKKISMKSINSIVFALNDLTTFFEGKEDFHTYKEALLQGKLRKKLDILFFADKMYVAEGNKLFSEVNSIHNTSFLLTRDKISLSFLKGGHIGMFLVYRAVYRKMFFLKNKLFNRS